MTMDCSPGPGTATALDHPPCDVFVCMADPFGSLPVEFDSFTDNLRRSGFRVDDNGFSYLFSRYATPARVNVIILSRSKSSDSFPWSAWESFATVMRSGVPVIPVYWDVEPDEVQDELESFIIHRRTSVPVFPIYWEYGSDQWRDQLICMSACHATIGRFKAGPIGVVREAESAYRRLLTISGHDLARYDGDGDKLKMDVFIEVSKVVNTHRIAEANELISQNHIYKKRVSVSEEKARHAAELARHAAELAVSRLKLLAGELLKHANG